MNVTSDAEKIRNWNVDDERNRDWIKLLLRLRGKKGGQFITTEGRTVFIGGPGSGGGGSSGGSISAAALARAEAIEDKIRLQDYETGAIIDQNGNTLAMHDGGAHQVDFDISDRNLMKDAVLTHNHPSDSSFSKEDVVLAIDTDMAAIRAAGRDVTYEMQRPVGGWPSLDSIARIMSKTEDDVFKELWGRINAREITPREANGLHYHEVWTRVGQALGIPYRRIER